jgi:hypothetical protein
MTDTNTVKFYEDAEAVLSSLPRRGVSMILREVRDGISKPYSFGGDAEDCAEFPANRENNREFRRIWPLAAILTPRRPANSMASS